jgi:hypothetical protein
MIWLILAAGCGEPEVAELDEESLSADDASEDPVDTAPAAARPEAIVLKLRKGDRFPLVKRIDQKLQQATAQGVVSSRSSIELMLSVTFEGSLKGAGSVTLAEATRPADDGRPAEQYPHPPTGAAAARNSIDQLDKSVFSVLYHRVRFVQEIPGQQRVEYDSDAPPARLPPEATAYHGLKGNGFRFWLAPDHRLLGVEDFPGFIDRCLAHVADPARQQQARRMLAATWGSDGIANFVEDSLGLLPPRAVREGDSWAQFKPVSQPVPMHTTTRYTLRKLTADEAQVDIAGTIAPASTYGPANQPNKDLQITVVSGESLGSCTIDRRTGLPVHSNVNQLLRMLVRLPNGGEFEQTKVTETTISLWPDQPDSAPISIGPATQEKPDPRQVNRKSQRRPPR